MKRRDFIQFDRGSRRSIHPARRGGRRHRADPRHGPAPRRRGHPAARRQLAHRRAARGQPPRARGGPAAASPRPAGRQGQLLGGGDKARRELLLPDWGNGCASHRVRVPDGNRQPEPLLLLERAEAAPSGRAGAPGIAAGVMRALEGGLRLDLKGRSRTQLPTARHQSDPPGTRVTRSNPPRRHADRAETT